MNMLESYCRRAGHRPRLPHRAGQTGLSLQAHHRRFGRGEDTDAAGAKKTTFELAVQRGGRGRRCA